MSHENPISDRKYDDIINLPHHTSSTRPRMSALGRAAQFAPFAALTGYEAAISETGRLTDRYIELTEAEKLLLNDKLRIIIDFLDEKPEVSITYFKPDERKEGGAYLTVTGNVKCIDEFERVVVLTDKRRILIEQIYGIDGEIIRNFESD